MISKLRYLALAAATVFASTAWADDKPASLAYADFSSGSATQQGGAVNGSSYSEKPGDATLGPLSAADGVLSVTGQFSSAKHSQWAGVGFSVESPDKASADGTRNLQEFTSVKIRLASTTAKVLRLRLLSTDTAVQNAGCYPSVMQNVTPTLTEYTIVLKRFAAESYCGGNGRSAAQTLPKVSAFEVVDAAQPVSERAVNFQVGSIEFLR
ncbi:MAG: hypothetical protein ABI605_11235 [Rhizobacter sp.]